MSSACPRPRLSAVWLGAILSCLVATPVWAQGNYIAVDYMKVAPGQDAAYLALEQEWKPVHQSRIDAGRAMGWYLFEVLSPTGTEADHNYVTVRVYDSFDHLENPFSAEILAAALPGVDLTEMNNRTLRARDLVRSETYQVYGSVVGTDSSAPPRYVAFNYMQVPVGGADAYLTLEDAWKTIHEVRVRNGEMAFWRGLVRVFPAGSGYAHNYATVDGYTNWSDLIAFDLDRLIGEAGLGIGGAELTRLTEQARDHVRGEVWILRDFVQGDGQ